MALRRRSYWIIALVCIGLGVMSCAPQRPARLLSVRNVVEARFATRPLGLGTLNVRGMVSTKNIEGMLIRDIGCLDICDNVIGLDFPDVEGHDGGRAPSGKQLVLDRALARARENKADFACMILKVKPRFGRSPNPNVLGSRYRIGTLEFVEVVDASSCPRSREDRPLRYDQKLRFSYGSGEVEDHSGQMPTTIEQPPAKP
jgi:hypothetical protein